MLKSIQRVFVLGLGVVLAGVLFAQTSSRTPDPMIMLNKVSNQMLVAMKRDRSKMRANPSHIYQLVDRYLLPNVDATGMSRSVLGRNAWMKATSLERKQFTQAFVHVVTKTYAGALNAYTDEKIQFSPIRGGYQGKTRLRINSNITRVSGPTIPVSYSLVLQNNQWKVYDLNVEGVGLLQSFHSQVSSLLSQGKTITQITRQLDANKPGNAS